MSETQRWSDLFQQWEVDHPGWQIRGYRPSLYMYRLTDNEPAGFLVRAINDQTDEAIYGVGDDARDALVDAARQIRGADSVD